MRKDRCPCPSDRRTTRRGKSPAVRLARLLTAPSLPVGPPRRARYGQSTNQAANLVILAHAVGQRPRADPQADAAPRRRPPVDAARAASQVPVPPPAGADSRLAAAVHGSAATPAPAARPRRRPPRRRDPRPSAPGPSAPVEFGASLAIDWRIGTLRTQSPPPTPSPCPRGNSHPSATIGYVRRLSDPAASSTTSSPPGFGLEREPGVAKRRHREHDRT